MAVLNSPEQADVIRNSSCCNMQEAWGIISQQLGTQVYGLYSGGVNQG